MNAPAILCPDAGPCAVQSPPRAVGELRLRAALREGQARIADLRQAGSLKALFPRSHGAALEAVFLNTAGGLTGGDRMQITAQAEAGARIVLSSQAAERGYRAQPGQVARVAVRLDVGEGGRIDWLPQETILFDGAALDRRLTVDLAKGAKALVVEPLIMGRAAMGEEVHDLWFRDRWDVRLDGRLVFADALRIAGDGASMLDRPGVSGGARALAGALYAGPDAEGLLDPLRALLPQTAGASLVREGMIFMRILGADGFLLRRDLIPALELLCGAALPKVWRL
jgi:urease accessory protein